MRRPRATPVEALVELAGAHLTGQSVSPSVERRHLVALVDAGVLTRQAGLGIDGTGRCTLNGQRLTPEAARALGASAAITTILLDHRGLPLSVCAASTISSSIEGVTSWSSIRSPTSTHGVSSREHDHGHGEERWAS